MDQQTLGYILLGAAALIIGYKLSHYLPPGSVIGTLEHPVHALNLAAVLEMLATGRTRLPL